MTCTRTLSLHRSQVCGSSGPNYIGQTDCLLSRQFFFNVSGDPDLTGKVLAERITTPPQYYSEEDLTGAQPYRCEDKYPWYSATDENERCTDWTGSGCTVPGLMGYMREYDDGTRFRTIWKDYMNASSCGWQKEQVVWWECGAKGCPSAPNPVGSMVECWKPTKPRSASDSDTEQNVVVSDADQGGVTQTSKFAKVYNCANEGCYKIIDPAYELQGKLVKSQGLITAGAVCMGLFVLLLLVVAFAHYKGWIKSQPPPSSEPPRCPKNHVPLDWRGTNRDTGWTCSGMMFIPGGCKKGCTGVDQTKGWERWQCKQCDFNLCKKCLRAWVTIQHDNRRTQAAIQDAAPPPSPPAGGGNMYDDGGHTDRSPSL